MGFRLSGLGFRIYALNSDNVRVPLINPPPPNLVLVPGVWRGGKKDGVPIMNSGGLGSGGLGGGHLSEQTQQTSLEAA